MIVKIAPSLKRAFGFVRTVPKEDPRVDLARLSVGPKILYLADNLVSDKDCHCFNQHSVIVSSVTSSLYQHHNDITNPFNISSI